MPSDSPLGTGQRPLLTIAVPTFNRAAEVQDLLRVLLPQLAALPQVELLVSDNASSDETSQVLASAAVDFPGVNMHVHRHETNIGADGNFASCFKRASGHFFWMCGDDDRIVPGAVAEVMTLLQGPDGLPAPIDLVYATSYGYYKDFQTERRSDPFGRTVHAIHDARVFAKVVNIMFTFISGMIVNKTRFEAIPHEDPQVFVGTNLVQLSWTLPLLQEFRTGAVLWTRPVAARLGNAHGYAIGKVFGGRLADLTTRLLPERPDLAALILNFALRRWFPSVLLDVRSSGNKTLHLDEAAADLRHSVGGNPRYWLFTYPALKWPLPLAKLYTRGTAILSKVLYMLQVPGFWRKRV